MGKADWEPIGDLKADSRMEIPVIGNGDVTTPEEAQEAFEKYGVDGVMIGRGSIGAPWIFREIKEFLNTGKAQEVTIIDKFSMLLRQIKESIESKDEKRGILHIRRHLAATPLLKGLPDFRPTRIKMLRADTFEELESIFENIKKEYFSNAI